MEPKKNPQSDLSRKKSLFFNIGMIMSLSLCLIAFEWKTYEDLSVIDYDPGSKIIEDPFVMPLVEEKIEPPKVKSEPEIKEVENDVEEELIKIETEIPEVAVVAPPQPPAIETAPEVPEEDPNTIFTIVESPAAPVGGLEAFYKYISRNIKYPDQARRMGVEGRVFVQFVVDKDGSITNVEVLKGIGSGCDEEALRVVKAAPNWTPGKQRGRPVKVRMSVPITFKLG